MNNQVNAFAEIAQSMRKQFKNRSKQSAGKEYKFSDLHIGDMFNTVAARWVKTEDKKATVVMSSVLELGYTINIPDTIHIIILYSPLLHKDLS